MVLLLGLHKDFGVTGIDIGTQGLNKVYKDQHLGTYKVHVRFTSAVDPKEFILDGKYHQADDHTGWWDLDVVPVASTGTSPRFTLDEDVTRSI